MGGGQLREELMGAEAEEEAGSDVGQQWVIVHLLGTVEDTRLFALPADSVLTWAEGLDLGCHTRATKSISQALRDGEWLYSFHLSKWLSLENERRRRQAESVRRRPGEQWIGRRVSVLWEDDAQWYVGEVRQYNAMTQTLCVLYEDNEVEWVDIRNVYVSDDAFRLPLSADNAAGVNEEIVRSAYRTFHLYDDEQRTEAEWDELLRVRARVEHQRAEQTMTADPAVGEVSDVCWECDMVEDVYTLASQMGMRAGGLEKDKKRENVNCVRCTKVCHARCFKLMCDSLSHGSAADGEEEAGSRKRAKEAAGGRSEGWQVPIDVKKPRCLDCLKCEHCGLFGAKGMRPVDAQVEADGADDELSFVGTAPAMSGTSGGASDGGLSLQSLRSPADMLTCDVCDVRVHRQCLAPSISDEQAAITGGWVCRHCITCRSCGTTAFPKQQPKEEAQQQQSEQHDDTDDSQLADTAMAVDGEAEEGAEEAEEAAMSGELVAGVKKTASHKAKKGKGKSATGKSHKKKVPLAVDTQNAQLVSEAAEAGAATGEEQSSNATTISAVAAEAEGETQSVAATADIADNETAASMEVDAFHSSVDQSVEPAHVPAQPSQFPSSATAIASPTSTESVQHTSLDSTNGIHVPLPEMKRDVVVDTEVAAALTTEPPTAAATDALSSQLPDETQPILSSQLTQDAPSVNTSPQHFIEQAEQDADDSQQHQQHAATEGEQHSRCEATCQEEEETHTQQRKRTQQQLTTARDSPVSRGHYGSQRADRRHGYGRLCYYWSIHCCGEACCVRVV